MVEKYFSTSFLRKCLKSTKLGLWKGGGVVAEKEKELFLNSSCFN